MEHWITDNLFSLATAIVVFLVNIGVLRNRTTRIEKDLEDHLGDFEKFQLKMETNYMSREVIEGVLKRIEDLQNQRHEQLLGEMKEVKTAITRLIEKK